MPDRNFRIRQYSVADAAVWNSCVLRSRNATFLHHRSYMDYHADRFPDASLLILDGETLVAVLPATIRGDELHSHAGLTYGGLVVGRDFHGTHALPVFAAIRDWCIDNKLRKLMYKAIPHIYHKVPAEEDLYALARVGARLCRRDLSTAICLAERYPVSKGRRACLSRGKKDSFTVRLTNDYEEFMRIEADHLKLKHGVSPTHNAEEIALLASRFPENIRLVGAYDSSRLLGGVIVYISNCVCHAQYIGATDEGKRRCVLDACIEYILANMCGGLRWFDFGISTTDSGRVLDNALLMNKESWGGRSIVYDHYELVF